MDGCEAWRMMEDKKVVEMTFAGRPLEFRPRFRLVNGCIERKCTDETDWRRIGVDLAVWMKCHFNAVEE